MKTEPTVLQGQREELTEDLTTDRQKKLYAEAIQRMDGFLNKELSDHLVKRIMTFSGNFDVLEKAVGALIIGQLAGWRVLTLLHSSRTLNRYQKELGLDFKGTFPWDPDRIVMPEIGPFARKSFAFEITHKLGNFWKVVRGQADEVGSAYERKKSENFG